jgi:hypothetical protein
MTAKVIGSVPIHSMGQDVGFQRLREAITAQAHHTNKTCRAHLSPPLGRALRSLTLLGPLNPYVVLEDRLARIEKERSALRRELNLLQDNLTDIEAQIAQIAPILKGGSLLLSGLRSVAAIAMLPVRGKNAKTAPAVVKRLKEAKLRSERLVEDPRRGWISRLDVRAYLSNASRAIGLSTPPIYR